MRRGTNKECQKQREEILELVKNGMPDIDISQKYGCSLIYVEKIRHAAGIYRMQHTARFYRAMYDLMYSEKTYVEISKEMGLAMSAIRQIAKNLKRYGFVVPVRPRGNPAWRNKKAPSA